MKQQFTLILFILAVFQVAGQDYENCPGIEWERSYGGSRDERIGYAIPTRDSGFLLSGSSFSPDIHLSGNNGARDAAIIKIDGAGQFLWGRNYGGPGDDLIYAMTPAPEGGYFFAGLSGAVGGDININAGESDSWVGKVNEQGTLQWQQSFGGAGRDYAYSLQPTPDGGCLSLGITSNGRSELARFSAEGNLLWKRNYSHLFLDAPLLRAGDGNFFLSSYSRILKISPQGTFLDSMPLPSLMAPLSLKELPDASLILVCNTNTTIYEGIIVLRIDSTGAPIWETRFNLGVYQDTRDVWHTEEGEFYVLSRLQNSGPPFTSEDYDYCLSRLDTTGQILQHRIFGGARGDEPQSLLPAADGGLLLSGDSRSTDGDVSSPIGPWDFWVVKLNEPMPFSLPADTTYCEDAPLELGITQPSFVDIQWSDGSQGDNISINNSGIYLVEASVGDCSLRDTTNVRLPLVEWEGLPTDTSLCEDDTYPLDATLEGAALYLWQDGSREPLYQVVKPGRYLVKAVVDECVLEDSITVSWCKPCLAIPNAFTPNGDGVNDFFAPILQCPFPAYGLRAFNRWGELVFETEDPEKGWDGTFNGQPAPSEVYFYQLSYQEFEGEPAKRRQGDVLLLR